MMNHNEVYQKVVKELTALWREIERWFAEHDWLRRKLCRVRISPPRTCEGYGEVKSHPH